MKRQKRNTLILAVVLLALLAGGFLIQKLFFSQPGSVAVVQLGSQIVGELKLSKDTQLLVGDRESGYGFNLVEVQGGRVRVVEADCSDLTCVHTGWAEREGDIIACLPHGMIIYIEPEKR